MMVRTPYNYDRDEVSKNTALVFNDETLTQQNFKDDADLNIMIRKYGVLPVQEVNWNEFDVSVIPSDYHQLQNKLIEADQAFMGLPAELRSQVDNDPAKLLALISQQEAEAKAEAKAAEKAAKEASTQSQTVDADKPAE
jgi:hypothetical protein